MAGRSDDQMIRCLLFVPGVRPDRFARAVASGADAVVFDLEDSVDAARKAEARAAVASFLANRALTGAAPLHLVRVNGTGTPGFEADLAAVAALPGADGIVVPKSEGAAEIERAAREARARLLLPLIETARGVLEAPAIARADAPIPALLFGAEDLTAQLGVARTIDGEELTFARSQIVLAATAAGADAVDAVFIDVRNPDGLRRDAERARALGFRGKMAVHPDQVPVINEVFTPTSDEIAKARRIVEVFEAAQARGDAVVRVDNRMVDAPVVARARRLLASGRTGSA
jgi:citrate lyase subunit beta/citryl-CoA lyase